MASVITIQDWASRATVRISGDYLLDWIAAMRAPFGDFDLAVAFAAVVNGSIRHPGRDAELNGLPPGEGAPRQPMSARSLGRSIQLPHQTTRRHVEALIEGGWVERRDLGLIVAPEVLTGPRLQPAANLLMERLTGILTGLAALESPPPDFRLAPERGGLLLVLTCDFVLRWVERHIAVPGQVFTEARLNIGGLVFWAVMRANLRHVNDDPRLQRAYADLTLPDQLKRPVSVREIADTLELPYETLRGLVQKMIELGLLSRVGRGLIVSEERLATPRSAADHRINLTDLRRLLSQLTECGVLLPA
ncbi:putative transcriptional regulator [Caulobacter ginsengisoli]|uniref:Transcriptional regulator n=1 Tax=Caulobacter ginsengisoli TaxID=400775 RepID=A0ABU0IVG1_9CAUL|nr:hypothetical protein [Caulobacter ginsengisoli]MDQ0465331.1 putative transcriptional regulator [Caulobacter ginsengisoli]